MFNQHVGDSGRCHPLIVLGSTYITQQWGIRSPTIGAEGLIGRLSSDTVSGSGAVVATIYSKLSKRPTRLITVIGRDAAAQRVRQWSAMMPFDLIPTVVAARTGRQCKVVAADGQVLHRIIDNSSNLLLSEPIVQANVHKWTGSVCVSLDMGTNTLETVVANAGSFANFYILGSGTLISNYRLLSVATILFLEKPHLEILWGKPIRSENDLSNALPVISQLGVSTICVYLSKHLLVLYHNHKVSWFGTDAFKDIKELRDSRFDLCAAATITLVESGLPIDNALDAIVTDNKPGNPDAIYLDDAEWLRDFALHD